MAFFSFVFGRPRKALNKHKGQVSTINNSFFRHSRSFPIFSSSPHHLSKSPAHLAHRSPSHPKMSPYLFKSPPTPLMTQINTPLPIKYWVFAYHLRHHYLNLSRSWPPQNLPNRWNIPPVYPSPLQLLLPHPSNELLYPQECRGNHFSQRILQCLSYPSLHKFPVLPISCPPMPPKVPKDECRGKPLRFSFPPNIVTVTAPTVFRRIFNQPRTNRVHVDISG